MYTSSSIVQSAMTLLGYNQTQMSLMLRKSQSSISKYRRGKVSPPADVIIHCMNIIESHPSNKSTEIKTSLNDLSKSNASKQFINSIETLIHEHLKALKEN